MAFLRAPSKTQEPLGKGFPCSKVPTLYPEYPKPWRSSLRSQGSPKMLGCNSHGGMSVLLSMGLQLSQCNVADPPALPAYPSSTSQAHSSLFSTLNNQETLWLRCHHASALVLGTPKTGTPLQVGQRLEQLCPGWDQLPSPCHGSRKKHLPPRLFSCLLLILEQGQDRFRRKSTGTESWGSLQI